MNQAATKYPFPNQHVILHQMYPNDCCLCKAEARIAELETKLKDFEERFEALKALEPKENL